MLHICLTSLIRSTSSTLVSMVNIHYIISVCACKISIPLALQHCFPHSPAQRTVACLHGIPEASQLLLDRLRIQRHSLHESCTLVGRVLHYACAVERLSARRDFSSRKMARKPSRADMVRIRLVLRGCTNRPFFNIVVTHANRPFNTGKLLDHVST